MFFLSLYFNNTSDLDLESKNAAMMEKFDRVEN